MGFIAVQVIREVRDHLFIYKLLKSSSYTLPTQLCVYGSLWLDVLYCTHAFGAHRRFIVPSSLQRCQFLIPCIGSF